MRKYFGDILVTIIIAASTLGITLLIIVMCAQQHYFEAVEHAKQTDGTDASIERSMWNDGFNIEAMNPEVPKLSAKIRALFYDLPSEDGPTDQEYCDECYPCDTSAGSCGWWNPAVNELRIFLCIKRNEDLQWYITPDSICDSCAEAVRQGQLHGDEYYDQFNEPVSKMDTSGFSLSELIFWNAVLTVH